MPYPQPLDHFPEAWRPLLPAAVREQVLPRLAARLKQAEAAGEHILPPRTQWFRALDLLAPDAVKIVILGQDPYPTPGNANGLALSVTPGTEPPRSLKNMFQELESDLGVPRPASGDLSGWAKQGVLLLNTTLTVQADNANSHSAWGWEQVTDALIHGLSERRQGLVFILWGNNARKKLALIDRSRHLVLESAHPSPLSARRGFFGSRPYSQANAWLSRQGVPAINWTGSAA